MVVLYFDGGWRKLLDVGGYGFLITDDAGVVISSGSGKVVNSGGKGRCTNNTSEYAGLINGLMKTIELCQDNGELGWFLKVVGDSMLVIKQMSGEFNTYEPRLLEMNRRAKFLCGIFSGVEFEWRKRDDKYIQVCDKLADEAIGQRKK